VPGSVLRQHTAHFVHKFVLLPDTLLDQLKTLFFTILSKPQLWKLQISGKWFKNGAFDFRTQAISA
jgi:hypothetical protein